MPVSVSDHNVRRSIRCRYVLDLASWWSSRYRNRVQSSSARSHPRACPTQVRSAPPVVHSLVDASLVIRQRRHELTNRQHLFMTSRPVPGDPERRPVPKLPKQRPRPARKPGGRPLSGSERRCRRRLKFATYWERRDPLARTSSRPLSVETFLPHWDRLLSGYDPQNPSGSCELPVWPCIPGTMFGRRAASGRTRADIAMRRRAPAPARAGGGA